MYKYKDIIWLKDDVKIEILGVFNGENIFYYIDINGIKKKIDGELLNFFINKYKEVVEVEEEEYKKNIETKKEKKNGKSRNKNEA